MSFRDRRGAEISSRNRDLFMRLRRLADSAEVTAPEGPTRLRKAGWEGRLNAVIDAARSVPFVWGISDCSTFAADVVLALCDVDPMVGIRLAYTNQANAYLLISQMTGGGDLGQAAEGLLPGLGMPEIAPGFAQAGDVALITTDDGPMMAIVYDHRVVAKTPNGVAFVARENILRTWAV